MNSNTYLKRFGLDPNDFKHITNEPIITDNGYIYLLEQSIEKQPCPYCLSKNIVIKDYYFKDINISSSFHIKDIFRIKMCRFKCKECKRTFVKKIFGIEEYNSISNMTKKLICCDFYVTKTFKEISERYHCSISTVIDIFDNKIARPIRYTLPEVLCIDEFYFSSNSDAKYCVLLIDWKTKKIIDIIQNRQLITLTKYFSNIDSKERNKVKFFVSDLYDGYRTIRQQYFKKATHIADFFHITIQLTRPINSLRNAIMKQFDKNAPEYKFMSKYWKLFQCKSNKISQTKEFRINEYTYSSIYDYFYYCVKLNDNLLTGYNALQELFSFQKNMTYTKSQECFNWLINKLISSSSQLLIKAGETYKKWLIEIGNAYTFHEGYISISNGIAEGINNVIKTIIKDAYGFHNFERFRKRALLLLRH